MSLSRSGQASGAAPSTGNAHMSNSGTATGAMGILATNGEKIQGYKYGQNADGSAGAATAGGATNPVSSTTGYTYSPSSTFQMAGNEQIQGKYNLFHFES